jgi:hypothetical protein
MFARSILAVTALLAPPALADIVPLKEGDVYCIGFDEKTNSCTSVQTLKELGGGEYFVLDLAGFAFGETNLDMTATLEAVEREGKICIKPGGVKVSVTPKTSKMAEGWQNLMAYQLDEMVAQDYCFEHQKCDDEWVAIAWVDGKPHRELSATFRIFTADDPRSKTVQPRYLGLEELNTMQQKVEDKCFPKET